MPAPTVTVANHGAFTISAAHAKIAVIPGTNSTAQWTGTRFEVVPCVVSGGWFHPQYSPRHVPVELYTWAYWPIDPRMTTSDVDGAIRAYANETNDGWLFAHTDEGTHHDYELILLGVVDGLFQPLVRQYQVDAFSDVGSVATRGKHRFIALSSFYGEVVAKVREIARMVYLGQREQQAHPREGWIDRDITNALATVKAAWIADSEKATAWAHIKTGVAYLENSLIMPSVETRWARVARLAAEAKAKENANSDSEAAGGNGS